MKNTFLKSPAIALQHIQNSAWAIKKLYSKNMCKKRLFTRSLHYNYDGHASTIFTLCLDEIQGSKKSSGTWLHLARLHSGKINHFNFTSAEKTGVNKTANSENIFKRGHLSNMGDLPFDLSCHSEINTQQLLI